MMPRPKDIFSVHQVTNRGKSSVEFFRNAMPKKELQCQNSTFSANFFGCSHMLKSYIVRIPSFPQRKQ